MNALDGFFTEEKVTQLNIKTGFMSELKAAIGLFGGKVQGNLEVTAGEGAKQKLIAAPEIGVNTIVKFLKPSRMVVVLEDFHYCSEDLKSQLSQDLKAFSDECCPWVIVGIQHKTSALLSYNMDLQERIAELPVEGFSNEELRQIIDLGELALNLKISEKVKEKIVGEAIGSASLVQNICLRMCLINNIEKTMSQDVAIEKDEQVAQACQEIASENKTYYERVIRNIAVGGRSDGSTEKYKWFLRMIKETPIPEQGLKNTDVCRLIKDLGHKTIEQGSVTSGLAYLPSLLSKNGFPPFFDYDAESRVFYLLDKYMKFVLKWVPTLVDDLFVQDAS